MQLRVAWAALLHKAVSDPRFASAGASELRAAAEAEGDPAVQPLE